MRPVAHKLEVIADKLVPIALVMLLAVIAAEVFWPSAAEEHHTLIQAADWTVLAVFATDVFFKFRRSRSIPRFLRTSWMDIIAIFPFFLVFRLFEGLLGLIGVSETVARSQQVLHAGIEIEKEAELALKEGSKLARELSEATRAEKLSKFLKPLARSTRLFILGDPHVREDIKKEKEAIGRAQAKAGRRLKRAEKRMVRDAIKKKDVLKAALFYEKPGLIHRHLNAKRKISPTTSGKSKCQPFFTLGRSTLK